jgi:diaminohydroxyphosphoribosylaminopyrimidine deaminase/5-amino-6-(5-phosphoribosylamino)uracil reductase
MEDIEAMQLAIVASRRGLGRTAPNPIVGAVILDDHGNLISEGFHDGGDHAEVDAIKNAGTIAPGSTIYITLEPCNHFGKTPPCTDAIIANKIARVVYAIDDPNPVARGGAQKLRDAGIEVTSGLLKDEAAFVNRDWLTKIEYGRPRITWKIGTTLDGRTSAIDGTSKWITSEASRAKVKTLRDESDAIVIGTGTALADNPALLSKMKATRVVLGDREIPRNHQLNNNEAETIFVKGHDPDLFITLAKERGWNRILLESGPKLGTAFVKAGLVDELHIFMAPTLFGAGKNFIGDLGVTTITERFDWQIASINQSGPDLELIVIKSDSKEKADN